MAQQAVPTKGNLMAVKKSLALARVGYELLDKKRNILIREMMALIDRASEIQGTIDKAFSDAYIALQKANITLGFCDELSKTIPIDDSVTMDSRSIMGVEIPILSIEKPDEHELHHGLSHTNARFDEAVALFMRAKYLTVELAEIENSVYRLAVGSPSSRATSSSSPTHSTRRTERNSRASRSSRNKSKTDKPSRSDPYSGRLLVLLK